MRLLFAFLIVLALAPAFLTHTHADVHRILDHMAEKSEIRRIIAEHYALLRKEVPLSHQNRNSTFDPYETNGHTCQHDTFMERSGLNLNYDPERLKRWAAELDPEHTAREKRALEQATWGPLRMYVDTSRIGVNADPQACSTVGAVVSLDGANYRCLEADVMTQVKADRIKNVIVPAITKIISAMLQVKRGGGNLVLPIEWFRRSAIGQNCRLNLPVPDHLLTTGQPDADYYMFIVARPLLSTSTLANAGPCAHAYYSDGHLSRPLAGSINWNPAAGLLTLAAPTERQFQEGIMTGIHEVFHALGFSAGMYQHFISPHGTYYPSPDLNGPARVFTRTPSPTWKLWRIESPRVTAFARALYGCPSLAGAELEDNDGQVRAGQAPGSHWERRVIGPEVMSPVISTETVVSKLTLAFFEDSGWYKADYALADEHVFGVGAGCDWIQKQCDAATWGRYFCDSSKCPGGKCGWDEYRCNGERSAVAGCALSKWSAPLPSYYQHFTDPTIGGGDVWTDYCPLWNGFSNYYCHDTAVTPFRYGETFGPSSNCFEGTQVGKPMAGCFERKCTTDASGKPAIALVIGGQTFPCPASGGTITVNDGKGNAFTINCPDGNTFCNPLLMKNSNFPTWSPGPAPPPSPPPAPGPAPGTTQPLDTAAFLSAHNRLRSPYGLTALVWDQALASTAQAHANKCKFTYATLMERTQDYALARGIRYDPADPSQNVGENLMSSSGNPDTSAWAAEASSWTCATDTCAAGKSCGSYKAMIWGATTRLGCAISLCPSGAPWGGTAAWKLLVCRYNPASSDGPHPLGSPSKCSVTPPPPPPPPPSPPPPPPPPTPTWTSLGGEFARMARSGSRRVLLAGLAQSSGSWAEGPVIASLPSTYGPAGRRSFPAISSGDAQIRVDVVPGATPQVVYGAGGPGTGWISLDRIGFLASPVSLTRLTLMNNLVAASGYQAPAFGVDGLCFLAGRLTGTSIPANTKIGTLPTTCRPSSRESFSIVASERTARVDILPDGSIMYMAGASSGWISLDGIAFFSGVRTMTAIPASNAWTTQTGYAAMGVAAAGDSCALRGVVRSGTGTTIGTLPTSCRPVQRRVYSVACSHSLNCRVDVLPTGVVQLVGRLPKTTTWPTWVSLSGIIFDKQPDTPL